MTAAPFSTIDRASIDAADRADLVRAFSAWTGDPATADDLAQETLLAAWTSTRQPERAEEWRPWLFGVARNVLLRWRTVAVRRRPERAAALATRDGQTRPAHRAAARKWAAADGRVG